MTEPQHKRQIRSFVQRAGRMTAAQQRGIDQGFARYGRKSEQGILIPARNAEQVLEIGFGMGHAFIEQVRANPSVDFIGVEVHTPGVGSVLNEALEYDLQNLVVYSEDANQVLDQCITDQSLSKIQLFFPDPWPKKRHHKRRLVQTVFIEKILPKLKMGGTLHFATDWEPYAEHMLEILEQFPQLKASHQTYLPRFSTRFERRGLKLGHKVTDLWYTKVA